MLVLFPILSLGAGGGESVFLGVILISLVHLICIGVALWRSANVFDGPKIWGILAKLVVVLGGVRSFLNLCEAEINAQFIITLRGEACG